MSLRSSGFWCDVCNTPMVHAMFTNEPISGFKLSCSDSQLHYCGDECLNLMLKACETLDTSILKKGPLQYLLEKVKEHNAKHGDGVPEEKAEAAGGGPP